MEANISQGGIMPGGPPFGGLDLHGSMRVHQHPQAMNHHQHTLHRQGSGVNPCIHEICPLTMETMHNSDQSVSLNDEDEPSYTEEGVDGQNDVSKGKKVLPWQRVKWTDKMVRLLITAVSYIGEDVTSDCGGGMRRKFSVLQKKGKWKSVSKVMAERGFHVSPQQCEDKFNDLNKRYKRLNDMLGRGTSCQVVEKPELLDVIDYLTEKQKDVVRKILNSKHLFYEEMCSYHNGNRLHLPHDPALQRSVRLALRSRDDHENDELRRHQDDLDEDDQELETDDHDDCEENHTSNGGGKGVYGLFGGPSKRSRPSLGHGGFCYVNSSQDGNKGCHPHPEFPQVDMNQVSPEGTKAAWLQKQWTESRKLQLEEQKLQIEVEMLELEKQRFKWQRFSKKKDHELEKLRMENERMKLENERMALELKRKEMGANFA